MTPAELGHVDVLVIGAGNAAANAALSAHEAGASVAMIETAPREARGGNSAFTGGAFRFTYSTVDDLLHLLVQQSGVGVLIIDRQGGIVRVNEALSRMTDRRIRHLPVCEKERLVGIVSIGDLVKSKISEVEAEADGLKAYIAAS